MNTHRQLQYQHHCEHPFPTPLFRVIKEIDSFSFSPFLCFLCFTFCCTYIYHWLWFSFQAMGRGLRGDSDRPATARHLCLPAGPGRLPGSR